MRAFWANSTESSSMYRLMTVPLSVLSLGSRVYSGEPSQVQRTALAPSTQLRVSMVTFFETIKAE